MTEKKQAEQLSPCTCEPALKSGHYANCPSENQADIAEALEAARKAGAAAERERIRRSVEVRMNAAAVAYSRYKDSYSEGARDVCDMLLQAIDAGEPTPATDPTVEAPEFCAPHTIQRGKP